MSLARRPPVGVVGVISPFNVPLILSIRSVAPALTLGNAVALEPDPRTAVTGGVIIARVLQEAGLPEGVLHIVPGGADIGQALVEDPRVRVISFTGSTAVGSVDGGASLAAGGTYEGLFYRPTVMTDISTDSPAYANEVFGPVAPITPFDSIEEAVALASDTEYGLSLGILTRDVMKGVELADRIPSGIVHINDQTISDEAVAPFGGVGVSGTGARLGGPTGNLESFTETQWLTLQGEITGYPF